MDEIKINSTVSIPPNEIEFRFSRSGGPGGQNVNKVSTKVELVFNLETSQSLSKEEKELVRRKLHSSIDTAGNIKIVCQESRSQYANKQSAIEKFTERIRKALVRQIVRVATKPTRTSTQKRIQSKKKHGAIKSGRSKKGMSEE